MCEFLEGILAAVQCPFPFPHSLQRQGTGTGTDPQNHPIEQSIAWLRSLSPASDDDMRDATTKPKESLSCCPLCGGTWVEYGSAEFSTFPS